MGRPSLLSLNRIGNLPQWPTDFFYRELVPRDHKENLKFRRRILDLGYESDRHARELQIICARDILFSINAFGWTLDPRKFSDQPIRPFITYRFQDRDILELQASIGKEDIAVPKTRDMGASWICVLTLEHFWRFRPNQLFLLASRKKELVEGDERSLFAKIRWYLERLPIWLKPEYSDTQMHLHNSWNGSRLDGEATVENLGTGDRRTAILLDEVAKMEKADRIFTSTRDVTECRIFNSTPYGRYGIGKPFYDRVRNPSTKKIFMHWSEHPLKNAGLFKVVGGRKVNLDPETYDWRKDYDFRALTFKGDGPRSPWYDTQCRREGYDPDTKKGNRVTVAQELDIDFAGSSEQPADPKVIAECRESMILPALFELRFGADPDTCDPHFEQQHGGELKLWCPFDGNRPPFGEYAIGIDTCAGTGSALSSNSSAIIYDRVTREQVGRLVRNDLMPDRWGKVCIALARWFWDAMLVPEAGGMVNGQLIKTLRDHHYPNIFQRDRDVEGMDDRKVKKYGVSNTDRGTRAVLTLLSDLASRKTTIRDELILEELEQYEWGADGKIFHAGAQSSDMATDSHNAHGDACIGAALGNLSLAEVDLTQKEVDEREDRPLPNHDCMARRMHYRELAAAASGEDPTWEW